MNRELLEQLLYRDEKDEVLNKIKDIEDEKTLFVFSYNYNWDNGFQIPSVILENENCTLSVALMLFYNADGLNYLQDKRTNDNLPEWSNFIELLYKNIVKKKYILGKISFEIPKSISSSYSAIIRANSSGGRVSIPCSLHSDTSPFINSLISFVS